MRISLSISFFVIVLCYAKASAETVKGQLIRPNRGDPHDDS